MSIPTGLMKPTTVQMSLPLLLLSVLVTLAGSSRGENGLADFRELGLKAKLKHVDEWFEWKQRHDKSYDSTLEELERHLIWLSNRKYIEQHNANAKVFGFTLSMNHLGDMVRIIIVLDVMGAVDSFHIYIATKLFSLLKF